MLCYHGKTRPGVHDQNKHRAARKLHRRIDCCYAFSTPPLLFLEKNVVLEWFCNSDFSKILVSEIWVFSFVLHFFRQISECFFKNLSFHNHACAKFSSNFDILLNGIFVMVFLSTLYAIPNYRWNYLEQDSIISKQSLRMVCPRNRQYGPRTTAVAATVPCTWRWPPSATTDTPCRTRVPPTGTARSSLINDVISYC